MSPSLKSKRQQEIDRFNSREKRFEVIQHFEGVHNLKGHPERWYQVKNFSTYSYKTHILSKWYGQQIEKGYFPKRRSMELAAAELNPTFEFLPWHFEQKMRDGFFASRSNLRWYLEWLEEDVATQEFLKENDRQWPYDLYWRGQPFGKYMHALRAEYGSIYHMFKAAFPQRDYKAYSFHKIPAGYFFPESNSALGKARRKEYYQWLYETLKESEGWLDFQHFVTKLRAKHLHENHGVSILKKIKPFRTLKEKEFGLEDHRIEAANLDYWQERILNKLGEEGIALPKDFHRLKAEHITECCSYLIHQLNQTGSYPSLFDVVTQYFPEYEIYPWSFSSISQGLFQDSNQVKDFLIWFRDVYHDAADQGLQFFYNASRKEIEEAGGHSIFSVTDGNKKPLYPDYPTLIKKVFPATGSFVWETGRFEGKLWKSQSRLYSLLESLTGLDLIYNYKSDFCLFQKTRKEMEFDIYHEVSATGDQPIRGFAVEYQGEQHFQAIDFFGGEAAFETQQQRDQEKRACAKKNNVFLIEIHYSWKRNPRFLVEKFHEAIVKSARLGSYFCKAYRNIEDKLIKESCSLATHK